MTSIINVLKSNPVTYSAAGAAIGSLGRWSVCVLTHSKITALSLGIWAGLGLIIGLALAIIFAKKSSTEIAKQTKLSINKEQLFKACLKDWKSWINKQLAENANIDEKYKEFLGAELGNKESFEKYFTLSKWSFLFIKFNEDKQTTLDEESPKALYKHIQESLKSFINYITTSTDIEALIPEDFLNKYIEKSALSNALTAPARKNIQEKLNGYLDLLLLSCTKPA